MTQVKTEQIITLGTTDMTDIPHYLKSAPLLTTSRLNVGVAHLYTAYMGQKHGQISDKLFIYNTWTEHLHGKNKNMIVKNSVPDYAPQLRP